ncbi:hypothetical protein NDU88_002786 [Pleurodeles waltl]|uniref:Uncharacterized protein n=1 Tax=Pleurodeles waltl TaxID=8319 RepID=A0AAV7M505_PLEWA|nr:hypothetical protein NDU88_002786 [Pleurodeles waltl]
MGRDDPREKKLKFDRVRGVVGPSALARAEGRTPGHQPIDLTAGTDAIMAEHRSGFCTIDGWVDEMGPIQYHGAKLSFFPDFTLVEQETHCKYTEVKDMQCKLGLRYGMLYPARLKVDVDGRARFFENPGTLKCSASDTPGNNGAPTAPLRRDPPVAVCI